MIDLPPACVTGIGSLPFTDPEEAVSFVAEQCPILPFWPQLPRRSALERALEQTLSPLGEFFTPRGEGPGYALRPGRLDEALEQMRSGPAILEPASASGLFAFDLALRAGLFLDAVAVKGQTLGPLTLSEYLYENEIPFSATPDRVRAAGAHVARLALWQIRLLSRASGKPVVFFLDEPGLSTQGDRIIRSEGAYLVEAIARVLEATRKAGALAGLHCCAPFPLKILKTAAPDLVSFDAGIALDKFFSEPPAQSFMQDGGYVAYGLVPTLSDDGRPEAQAVFDRWLAALEGAAPGASPVPLIRRSLVTAACGLGLVEPDWARRSFELAQGVSKRLAALA